MDALQAGLSLHVSFLHAPQNNRPTLVYDLIEEFRTFVVDRVVFRMFNQREPLRLGADNLLDDYTRKRIASKVIERLSARTRYKNASVEIDHIIAQQSYLLARAVKGVATYRGFVGRY
jgi:CRISPR-associated protein Cas1